MAKALEVKKYFEENPFWFLEKDELRLKTMARYLRFSAHSRRICPKKEDKMFIIFFLIIAFVVALIYFPKGSWKFSGSQGNDSNPGTSPLEILKKRYAKGEINKEEFEQKKTDLGY